MMSTLLQYTNTQNNPFLGRKSFTILEDEETEQKIMNGRAAAISNANLPAIVSDNSGKAKSVYHQNCVVPNEDFNIEYNAIGSKLQPSIQVSNTLPKNLSYPSKEFFNKVSNKLKNLRLPSTLVPTPTTERESRQTETRKEREKNRMEKPMFITTVKSGTFLEPPPEQAALLGLRKSSSNNNYNSIYSSLSGERGHNGRSNTLYSFASKPRLVKSFLQATTPPRNLFIRSDSRRMKRDTQETSQPVNGNSEGSIHYGNTMYDRRVARGSNFASLRPNVVSTAEAQRRAAVRQRAQIKARKLRTGTPPPVDGRRHEQMQTEKYLEELTEKTPEKSIGCQADLPIELDSTISYPSITTGVDVGTQVCSIDLPDYVDDDDVHNVVTTIVNKILREAVLEINEEIEKFRSYNNDDEKIIQQSPSQNGNAVIITKEELRSLIQTAIENLKTTDDVAVSVKQLEKIQSSKLLEITIKEITTIVRDVKFLSEIIRTHARTWIASTNIDTDKERYHKGATYEHDIENNVFPCETELTPTHTEVECKTHTDLESIKDTKEDTSKRLEITQTEKTEGGSSADAVSSSQTIERKQKEISQRVEDIMTKNILFEKATEIIHKSRIATETDKETIEAETERTEQVDLTYEASKEEDNGISGTKLSTVSQVQEKLLKKESTDENQRLGVNETEGNITKNSNETSLRHGFEINDGKSRTNDSDKRREIKLEDEIITQPVVDVKTPQQCENEVKLNNDSCQTQSKNDANFRTKSPLLDSSGELKETIVEIKDRPQSKIEVETLESNKEIILNNDKRSDSDSDGRFIQQNKLDMESNEGNRGEQKIAERESEAVEEIQLVENTETRNEVTICDNQVLNTFEETKHAQLEQQTNELESTCTINSEQEYKQETIVIINSTIPQSVSSDFTAQEIISSIETHQDDITKVDIGSSQETIKINEQLIEYQENIPTNVKPKHNTIEDDKIEQTDEIKSELAQNNQNYTTHTRVDDTKQIKLTNEVTSAQPRKSITTIKPAKENESFSKSVDSYLIPLTNFKDGSWFIKKAEGLQLTDKDAQKNEIQSEKKSDTGPLKTEYEKPTKIEDINDVKLTPTRNIEEVSDIQIEDQLQSNNEIKKKENLVEASVMQDKSNTAVINQSNVTENEHAITISNEEFKSGLKISSSLVHHESTQVSDTITESGNNDHTIQEQPANPKQVQVPNFKYIDALYASEMNARENENESKKETCVIEVEMIFSTKTENEVSVKDHNNSAIETVQHQDKIDNLLYASNPEISKTHDQEVSNSNHAFNSNTSSEIGVRVVETEELPFDESTISTAQSRKQMEKAEQEKKLESYPKMESTDHVKSTDNQQDNDFNVDNANEIRNLRETAIIQHSKELSRNQTSLAKIENNLKHESTNQTKVTSMQVESNKSILYDEKCTDMNFPVNEQAITFAATDSRIQSKQPIPKEGSRISTYSINKEKKDTVSDSLNIQFENPYTPTDESTITVSSDKQHELLLNEKQEVYLITDSSKTLSQDLFKTTASTETQQFTAFLLTNILQPSPEKITVNTAEFTKNKYQEISTVPSICNNINSFTANNIIKKSDEYHNNTFDITAAQRDYFNPTTENKETTSITNVKHPEVTGKNYSVVKATEIKAMEKLRSTKKGYEDPDNDSSKTTQATNSLTASVIEKPTDSYTEVLKRQESTNTSELEDEGDILDTEIEEIHITEETYTETTKCYEDVSEISIHETTLVQTEIIEYTSEKINPNVKNSSGNSDVEDNDNTYITDENTFPKNEIMPFSTTNSTHSQWSERRKSKSNENDFKTEIPDVHRQNRDNVNVTSDHNISKGGFPDSSWKNLRISESKRSIEVIQNGSITGNNNQKRSEENL